MAGMVKSAHIDTFANYNLPDNSLWPLYLWGTN